MNLQNRMLWQARGRGALIAILLLAACICFFPFQVQAANAPLTSQTGLLSKEEGKNNHLLASQAEILSEEEGKSNAPLTDQAGLLSEEEKEEISRQIEELEKATGWDIMAVTTEDAGGMDGEAYAETWFDEHTQKDDGVICAIDMDNREITVRAFGEAMFYINDDRTERILDAGYDKIADEQYGLGSTIARHRESRPLMDLA